MKTPFKAALISSFAAIAIMGAVAPSAFAQSATPAAITQLAEQNFFKKKYHIKGSWSVIQRDGQTVIQLSEDFRTKRGPDLKLFLSPKSASRVTGKNATEGSINIGALTSHKGAQEYVLPAGVNLSDFQTLLIHCEEFSVLWGGGAL